MPNAKHFQVIFDQSPVGMVILDTAGTVMQVNQAFCQVVQLSEDQPAGRWFGALLDDAGREFFQEKLPKLVTGEVEAIGADLCFRGADGESRWCHTDLAIVGGGGVSPYIFGTVDDVTQRKRNEIRLKRDKESAERATRTKSAFLANMSHEIRTPIHTISGMTDLLTQTRLDSEQKEYADQIGFAADVLLGLVNDILDFSKIEAGRLRLEQIELDLPALIEEAVDMVSLEAHKKGLEVVLFWDLRLPQRIIGDPVRIRQVLVNLFSNAIKFTTKGEIQLRTSRLRPKGGREGLRIQIIDTGVGIEAEKQAALFRSFSQVDGSTTRKFGGTGLGLSISRSLVKMMGGTIGVRSMVGVGSNFWFTLPLRIPVGAGRREPPAWATGLTHLRILVVEDNASNRILLRRYLGGLCAALEESASGEEGLQKLREGCQAGKPHDLVLADLSLPGIDGWQFASEVRAEYGERAPQLVLMSTTAFMAREAKMKLLNWFSAYVTKPIKWNALFESIRTALNQSAQVEEVASEYAEDYPEEPLELEPLDELETIEDEQGSAQEADAREKPGAERRAEAHAKAEPEQAALAEAAPRKSGGSDAPPSEATPRILLAEDHFVNRDLFVTILERAGCRVTTAQNGQEALEAVRNEPFDMVFLDVQMPVMNGYEAARRMRELGIAVPIIAVTANAVQGERDRCLGYGMNDFLAKPFKYRDVEPLLERFLSEGRQASEVTDSERETFDRGDVAVENSHLQVADPESRSVDSSKAQTPDREVFDYEACLAAFMQRADTVSRVVMQFCRKLPGQLQELDEALREGDYEQARDLCHATKGSALNLEANALAEVARELEVYLRSDRVGGALETGDEPSRLRKSVGADGEAGVEADDVSVGKTADEPGGEALSGRLHAEADRFIAEAQRLFGDPNSGANS